ncbi:UDP-3-O-(3-hydroxymyristoyl)glucosamine N-acyltransferase [Daejeonella oryzae]|uniref:UDP-3-O-(3-hydroxymyristoyl)glucosamine N-acyltransferase n=1 Tax=Daejeonella oryzae TaxID=1122943 RepID=UPI000419B375|nr:UDP-3-O-(3-hydroxymyristoyl)glucosamine N-acyltransferase [Daejeonella oryzae]
MQFTAHQIGLLLNGTLEGNPEVSVNQLAKIEDAQSGSLTFLANPKYEQFLYNTQASVIIVNEDLVLSQPVQATLIRVKDAYSAFSILLDQYNTIKLDKKGIEDHSFIHPTAIIGKNTYIGAFAYIGPNVNVGDNTKIYPHVYLGDNVSIGNNSTLFSGVKVYFDCLIGDHVTIHSSTVIGSDGFGFAPQKDGSFQKVSQIGNVIIEDHVEIGSNTCIDRATLGSTIIRKGVKLDNLIQIAHNVEIGSNAVVAAQTGISGSAKIGENCVIAGQVGVVGHINIAKGSNIGAKSGVNNSIKEENKNWNGVPLTNYRESLKIQVMMLRLPDMYKKIEELEKQILELTEGNKKPV